MVWKRRTGQNRFMVSDHTNKEALFNEVKGSLFEYLFAKEIAQATNDELLFQESLDKNYLTVLSQQDRMTRLFYPEMLSFLYQVSKFSAQTLTRYLGKTPRKPKVVGKFSNSTYGEDLNEADVIVDLEGRSLPVSLKLNKKNAFVNTKSGGIKSFFSLYFPFIDSQVQKTFNQFVDMEFNRMAVDLHALYDLEYVGDFSLWVKEGFSELPGELEPKARDVLKAYYARIALEMHVILTHAYENNKFSFAQSLPPLLGFGNSEILQIVCFHDFPKSHDPDVQILSYKDIEQELKSIEIKPFSQISSVEIDVGNLALQLRVKPMNKFTTTAIKINCSVKLKKPSAF